MRTRITVGTGTLAVGLLVLNLMSSPVYGQARKCGYPSDGRIHVWTVVAATTECIEPDA